MKRMNVLGFVWVLFGLFGCINGSESSSDDHPRSASQRIADQFWCGDNGNRIVVEEIDEWSSSGYPQQEPLHPIMPDTFPVPGAYIVWEDTYVWFAEFARRHAYWRDTSPNMIGNFLQNDPALSSSAWPSPWQFMNYSRPGGRSFTTGEEIGLWFYRWDADTYSLGAVSLSRPQPDSRQVSSRETYIGSRISPFVSPYGAAGSWFVSARVTCLNTSLPTQTPLDPIRDGGRGYSDRVATQPNLAIVRSGGCWTCFNY